MDRHKGRTVMGAMDAINGKQGRDRGRIATQGYARTWRLLSENFSQTYHAVE